MENRTFAPQEQISIFLNILEILHFKGVQRHLYGVNGQRNFLTLFHISAYSGTSWSLSF